MELPFTADQFKDVFGAYNDALWPVALVLWLSSAHALIQYFRRSLQLRTSLSLLAILWIWTGVVYHWTFFTAINPAAWLFGALFVIEALAFARLARTHEPVAGNAGARRIAALFLMVYALLYPAIVAAGASSYPRMPTWGVPCPVTIFTAGLLVAAGPQLPQSLALIPIAWAIVGGSAAFLLDVRADLMLFVAGLAMGSAFSRRPHLRINSARGDRRDCRLSSARSS